MTYQHRVFSDWRPDALVTVLRDLAQQAGSPVAFDVRFAALPPSQVRLRLRPGAVEFTCPQQFASDERRDFYANRWMTCWPLFATVAQRYPLDAACSLWVDDAPAGPGLAFCGNNPSSVLIPDNQFFETDGYAELRQFCRDHWKGWRARKDVCLWRGSSTGIRTYARGWRWQDLPRMALCLAVKELGRSDIFDVGISRLVQIHDPVEVAAIEAADITSMELPVTDFMHYRMAIDIDGNTCSWSGLFGKLLMGCTVLKVDSERGWRQWYYDRLLPWHNFVPVDASLSDLAETVCYLASHPGEAERIANRGADLADSLSMPVVLDSSAAAIFDFLSR